MRNEIGRALYIYFLVSVRLNNFEIEVRHSRHYPLGDQIAPLVGFYGTDGDQEGLEKSYDKVLSGTKGRNKYYKNTKIKQENIKILLKKYHL